MTVSADSQTPTGIGGWLLILAFILIVWGPVQYAITAASALPALPVRGLSLGLLLVWRLLVTALGVAAGLALLTKRGAAVGLARTSLLVSAATDTFVYLTPYFPNNRFPGDTPFYVAAALAWWGVWLAYLARSRRVKGTFD